MTPDTASQPKRVFLVDDHPLVREWLTNLINQQPGLKVCGEAESGPEAREKILALRPDVAIVDIALKDSSGIELIKDLKQSCPEVAVLVLSMHEESHYAERALRAGARGYVMKRETTRKVIAAISQVLEGKLCVSEAVAAAMAAQFVEGKTLATGSPVEQLSDRELEVFELLGPGPHDAADCRNAPRQPQDRPSLLRADQGEAEPRQRHRTAAGGRPLARKHA